MNEQEKLSELEEIMDVEAGSLKPDDILETYDEWDSVTALSLIALIDERFGKTVTGSDIRKLKTVADVLAIMEP